MRARLDQLVSRFAEHPITASRAMRDYLSEDRSGFLDEAVELLRQTDCATGRDYLLSLLAANELLISLLVDPKPFTSTEAAGIVRHARTLDPFFDVKLLRAIGIDGRLDSADSAQAGRVLEIVDNTSDGAHVMPLLTQLMRHSNPRVVSKAALLVGRMNRNLRWVEQRMMDPDARVRANAVESLWGLDSPDAREAFLTATLDSDNRVAGNGAVALYRADDCAAIRVLEEMANRGDQRFRATAAWAMGETSDARFVPALSRMISGAEPPVRQNVFRALARIRQRSAQAGSADAVEVTVLGIRSEGEHRVVPVCVRRGHSEMPKIRALDFLVHEDGEPVAHEFVRRCHGPDTFPLFLSFLANPILSKTSATSLGCSLTPVWLPNGSWIPGQL